MPQLLFASNACSKNRLSGLGTPPRTWDPSGSIPKHALADSSLPLPGLSAKSVSSRHVCEVSFVSSHTERSSSRTGQALQALPNLERQPCQASPAKPCESLSRSHARPICRGSSSVVSKARSPALLRLLVLVALQVVRQEAVPLLSGQPRRHHPRGIRSVQQAGGSSLQVAASSALLHSHTTSGTPCCAQQPHGRQPQRSCMHLFQ